MELKKNLEKNCSNLKGSIAILFTVILLLSIVPVVPTTLADPGDGLVLWNKLGSQTEIENSEVGPNATIYGSGISFVPGKFGSGFTAGGQTTGPNFGSWEDINPNYNQTGTVEFWWKPDRDFDEPDSPPDEVFVQGLCSDPWVLPIQFLYRWRETNGIGGFDFIVLDESLAGHYFRTGKVIPFQAGDWVHVAFVWDTNGLPNHPEVYYGTYVNGQYYPLVDCHNPGASINVTIAKPAGAYFSMGYYDADGNNRLEGVLDNVKIWDYAKTNFSDRFFEGNIGVTLTTNVDIPNVAITVTPGSIDFGSLEPGEESAITDSRNITIENVGGCDVDITTTLESYAGEQTTFYEQCLYLNDTSCLAYTTEIDEGVSELTPAQVQVPADWTEAGMKRAVVVFWAEKV